MIFVSLGCSIFVGASFEIIVAYFKTPKRYLSLIAIGLLFICLPYNGFRILNHIFYTPKDFFNGMVERLKTNYSNDCWWTTWIPSEYSAETNQTTSRLEMIAQKVVVGERKFELKTWQPLERDFVIEAGNTENATVATMYYPHWKVIINGRPAEVRPSETGLISFKFPPKSQ
ncbi:MAG: hypothetical protein HC846_13855, partial [Blastocatellia bacterium]|nr:hypothetical protein [Blastocatellia bacterium]